MKLTLMCATVLALVSAVCASAGPPKVLTPAAQQPALNYGGGKAAKPKPSYTYKAKGTSCFAVDPKDDTKGDRAQIRFWMAHGPSFDVSKVEGLKVWARLVPNGAGLNFPRGWTKQQQPNPLPNQWYRFALNMTVPDLLKDWDIQVDLTWDRNYRIDVHKKLSVPFYESNCPATAESGGSVDGGVMPAVAPAASGSAGSSK
jgi:hypothetical protein